jgi:hypothetical protein
MRPGYYRGWPTAQNGNRSGRENAFVLHRENLKMESGFQCAGCGEWNTTRADELAGRRQSYVEDCQVCCRPNTLRIEFDSLCKEFVIRAELE